MNSKIIVLVIAALAASISAYFLYRPFGMMDEEQSEGDGLLPLVDITKELDLCFFQRARSSFISCNRDEFSFSDSYGVIYAGWGGAHAICQGGRRVEKISDAFIMFSGTPDPSRCSFRLTVQFEDGEIFSRKVDLDRGPRPVPRYELVLANPGNNMPIAGIIYDHEKEDLFYIVTKLTY